MIRSTYFWTGAILLAIIPLPLMDIPKHFIDWKREVHDERMVLAKNPPVYSPVQRTEIEEQVAEDDANLKTLLFSKAGISLVLFGLSIYCFRKYQRIDKNSKWLAFISCLVLLAATTSAKLYSWTSFSGDEHIKLLTQMPADSTLANIYNTNFKGKVVYVDFWGTTCLPCLEEFKNFTKPLREKYKNRTDIAYLYIGGGTRLIWKQQLQKFDIEGYNLFLGAKDYAQLFHRSVRGAKDTILAMPRYLVMDKQGKIVETDAPAPSERDSIYSKLDKYLAVQ